jgi:hypothetical protein
VDNNKVHSVLTTTLKITQGSGKEGKRRSARFFRIRSRYIDATMTSEGRVRPHVELQIKNAGPDSESFLSEAVSVERKYKAIGGTIEKAFIHGVVCSLHSG